MGSPNAAARSTAVAGPTPRFSERSTLASYSTGSVRTSSYTTKSYSGYSHGGSHYHSAWRIGFGLGWTWSWGWGRFSIGWYYPHHYSYGHGYWPGCHSWSWGVHFGVHALAYLTGHHSWSIVAYPGYWGYSHWGRYCYYPRLWHRHRYCHDGYYFVVHRPYWYDYSYWWDYRPSNYGYSRYIYERLYDEGYDDGYDRGYEDGAEDTSAYRDGRRRESLERDDQRHRDQDRERGNAREEFNYEMQRGKAAFASGDYEEATRAFKEAVILDPTDVGAKLNLSVAAFASGKYAFAAFGLRRAVALDPEVAGRKLDIRGFYRDSAMLEAHIAELEKSARRESDADKFLVLGFVRLHLGEAEAAAASIEQAISLAPQDNAARALYAAALERIENK